MGVDMGDETEVSAAAVAVRKGRRPSVTTVIAAFIIFVAVFAHLYYGLSALFDLGVLGSAKVPPLWAGARLTEAGRQLFTAGFELALGAAALAILVGFLRTRRWAWVAAMTWVTVSLALGLVDYFSGEPHYLKMLAGVVLMLVLNQAALHRSFHVGEW
jgi:hypothetical protein